MNFGADLLVPEVFLAVKYRSSKVQLGLHLGYTLAQNFIIQLGKYLTFTYILSNFHKNRGHRTWRFRHNLNVILRVDLALYFHIASEVDLCKFRSRYILDIGHSFVLAHFSFQLFYFAVQLCTLFFKLFQFCLFILWFF
ncbi:hypothetical protein D3C86_1526400 [compost metagenome]